MNEARFQPLDEQGKPTGNPFIISGVKIIDFEPMGVETVDEGAVISSRTLFRPVSFAMPMRDVSDKMLMLLLGIGEFKKYQARRRRKERYLRKVHPAKRKVNKHGRKGVRR